MFHVINSNLYFICFRKKDPTKKIPKETLSRVNNNDTNSNNNDNNSSCSTDVVYFLRHEPTVLQSSKSAACLPQLR